MDAFALHLPKHLYTENRDEDGEVTGVTYEPERLAAWSEHGYGDASRKLCQQICNSEIEEIDAREEHQLLLLEEQWLELENGIDDDAEEAQDHLACEGVCEVAEAERQGARQLMEQRLAAIDKLVHESMVHLESYTPEHLENNYVGNLVALLMLAAVVYVLLT